MTATMFAHASIACTVALSSLLLAAPCAAQSVAVEAEHQRGLVLRAEGRHTEALAVFERLYAQTREPRALARMALAEGAIERWASAEEHLADAVNRTSDPWIQANRAGLEQNLVIIRAHLGALVVECATPGAELWVNGERLPPGSFGRPLRIPTGTAPVEIRADGHRTFLRSVPIDQGVNPHRLSVSLEPSSRPPEPPVVIVQPVVPPPPAPRPWRTVAWVGVGLSGVTGGFTLMVGLLAVSRYNDLVATCAPMCRQDDVDDIRLREAIVNVGIVSTALFATATVTAFVLDATTRPRPPVGPIGSPVAGFVPLPGGALVAVGGTL